MIKSLIFSCLFVGAMLNGSELTKFRKYIFTTYEKTNRLFDNAETQVELTMASGHQKRVVEVLFQKTFEWSLANAKNEQERKKVFTEFYNTVFDIGFDMAKSSQNMGGSSARMRFNMEKSSLMIQVIKQTLMSKEEKELWQAVNFAYGKLGKNNIVLNKGKCYFKANRYDRECELLAETKHPFTYNGKYFVIVRIDLPGSVNSDFLEQYLCEIENKQLKKIKKLDIFYLYDARLKNDKLFLSGEKTHSQGKYQKIIDLNI